MFYFCPMRRHGSGMRDRLKSSLEEVTPRTRHIRPRLALTVLLCVMFLPGHARAQAVGATLSAGSASGAPGDLNVVVPVSLSSPPEADVSGVQFDMSYDNGRLAVSGVTIGAAASSAGKSLSWSLPSASTVRVLVSGINQEAIGDGTIANILFNVLPAASPGVANLHLFASKATDPSASEVPLTLSDGSFTVNPPATTVIPTSTASPTRTRTPTATATRTPTSTSTRTITPTPSRTLTGTATRTPTRTLTRTASATPGPSPTPSRTLPASPTLPPSSTPFPATTSVPTITPSRTPTGTPNFQIATETVPPAQGAGPALPGIPPEVETAAVATGTALAELEKSVAATATALAGPGAADPSLSRASVLTTAMLLLAGLVIGAAAIIPAVVYLLARRPTGGGSRREESPMTGGKSGTPGEP